jgi:hypothetical protein
MNDSLHPTHEGARRQTTELRTQDAAIHAQEDSSSAEQQPSAHAAATPSHFPSVHFLPMDIVDTIASLADTQTISRIARASFACYEVAMPILLDRIEISDPASLFGAFGTHSQVSRIWNR